LVYRIDSYLIPPLKIPMSLAAKFARTLYIVNNEEELFGYRRADMSSGQDFGLM
jgi:hypothetical protein